MDIGNCGIDASNPREWEPHLPACNNPISGIAGCCARTTTGHATAVPSLAMNSRRRIDHASCRFVGSLSRPRVQGNGLRRRFADQTKGPFAATTKLGRAWPGRSQDIGTALLPLK
jgi:hypothetical protein